MTPEHLQQIEELRALNEKAGRGRLDYELSRINDQYDAALRNNALLLIEAQAEELAVKDKEIERLKVAWLEEHDISWDDYSKPVAA